MIMFEYKQLRSRSQLCLFVREKKWGSWSALMLLPEESTFMEFLMVRKAYYKIAVPFLRTNSYRKRFIIVVSAKVVTTSY